MDGSLSYKKFTFKAAIQLASPHTWVASVGPCFIAGALAVCAALGYVFDGSSLLDLRSVVCWVLMLFCAVLMQSATNTLNDYQDFKSGLDTAETILDETDASIVYNQINPRSALAWGIVLLGGAAVAGVAVALLSSWWLLVLGFVAAAAVVLYSAGPKPLSSLPLGELVSGGVMGGIITPVTFYAVTLSFAPLVLLVALIPTVAIAQIMLTNNTCDIERDRLAKRRTLPGILGFEASRRLNFVCCLLTFALLLLVLYLLGLYFGMIVVVAGFALCFPKINYLRRGAYDLNTRSKTMLAVVSYTTWLCLTTVFALLLGGVLDAVV